MKPKFVGLLCVLLAGAIFLGWLLWPKDGAPTPHVSLNDEVEENAPPDSGDREAHDADPDEDADKPAPDLTREEVSEEEVRRFHEMRPRRQPVDEGAFGADEEDPAGRAARIRASRKGEPIWSTPGTPPAEVPPALAWLTHTQNRRGWWHPGGEKDPYADQEPAPDPSAECVLSTAFGFLAGLRGGYSHKEGNLRQFARQAMLWCRSIQNSDGDFASAVDDEPVLHHAAATLAMGEAFRLSDDKVLLPILDKALEHLLETRNLDGGWGFMPLDGHSNVLATGFALLALRSAHSSGLSIPPGVFEDVAYWIWNLRGYEHTGWSQRHDEMPAGDGAEVDARPVADAVFVLALKWGGFVTVGDLSVDAALERLRAQPTGWDKSDPMARFWTSVALWKVDPDNAGEWSEQTVEAVEAAAIEEQRGTDTEPETVVSWTSSDWWSRRYGRTFTQSATAITLFQCRHNPAKTD